MERSMGSVEPVIVGFCMIQLDDHTIVTIVQCAEAVLTPSVKKYPYVRLQTEDLPIISYARSYHHKCIVLYCAGCRWWHGQANQ